MTAEMTVLEGLVRMPMSAPTGSDTELSAPKKKAAKADDDRNPMVASRMNAIRLSLILVYPASVGERLEGGSRTAIN